MSIESRYVQQPRSRGALCAGFINPMNQDSVKRAQGEGK